jgi:perosamine synthetase
MTDIPYGRQHVTEEDIHAVTEVLRGDWLTTGPTVDAFEAALQERLDAPHVVVLSSGTAALHGALSAARLGRGDEVVVAPLTFGSTAYFIPRLGASAVFADVDDATLTLDPAAAEAAMTSTTKVVLPVDYAGNPADLGALRELCESHGAVLIEDAAHAIGSTFEGEEVGSISDATTFSFHPVKSITTGEGGAVATLHGDYADHLRRFRNHGLRRDRKSFRIGTEGAWHQEIQDEGYNYRLSDINAALGLSQLRRLDEIVDQRAQLFARYVTSLGDVQGLALPEARPGCRVSWHLFVVRILEGRRQEVFDKMRAAGIGVQVHYLPVHLQPLFADLGYRAGMCPIAERAYQEVLSLPLFPTLSESEQDRVVDSLRGALA